MSDRLKALLAPGEEPLLSISEPMMTGTRRDLIDQQVIGNKVKKTYRTKGILGEVDLLFTDRRLLRTGARPKGETFMDERCWVLLPADVSSWEYKHVKTLELREGSGGAELHVVPWAGRASVVPVGSASEVAALKPVLDRFAAGEFAPEDQRAMHAKRARWEDVDAREAKLAGHLNGLLGDTFAMGCGTLVFGFFAMFCGGGPVLSILRDLLSLRFPNFSLFMLPGLVLGGLFALFGVLGAGVLGKKLVLGALALIRLPGVRAERRELEA